MRACPFAALIVVTLSFRANAQGWESMDVGARVSIRVTDSLLPPGLSRKNAIVGLVAKRE
jgi:hypothetical protein